MKLKLIAEAAPRHLTETDHGMWLQRGNEIVNQSSAKSLVVTALSKIRKMLGPMGLVKGEIQTNRPTEPIGPAVGPFDSLRRAVSARAKNDAMMLANGQGDREMIGQFWGIQLPTDYYDVEAGQFGKVNTEGQFDRLIEQTKAAAEKQPAIEGRIELLNQFAVQFNAMRDRGHVRR